MTDLVQDGTVNIEGDGTAFTTFVELLDSFELWFNIATP